MKSYVLITGAAGGLGKAFAAECAARGWDLLLTDLSGQALAVTAQGIERLYGVEVLVEPANLSDPASLAALWMRIRQRGLRIHMLVNVAGIDHEGPFSERSVEELCSIVRLNVEGTLHMSRRVLEFRDPARTLRIINVSSLASFYPMPLKAVYAASKRFLLDLSLALSQELRASDVTVTALCPAGMPTNSACIRAIDAQGFLGRVTTLNVGDVVARTLDQALAGRTVVVPGLVNRFMRLAGGLLPRVTLAWLINRRWAQARARAGAAVLPRSAEASAD